MNKRGAGRSLSERVAGTAEQPSPPQSAERPAHCWVVDPNGHPGTWPGVIVTRRRSGGGWWADVVYVVWLAPDPPVHVCTSLPFWQLRPV